MILNEEELNCLNIIARWFKEDKKRMDRDVAIKELGVAQEKYDSLIKTMEDIGALGKVHSVDQCYAVFIQPSPRAVQLAREAQLEKQRAEAPADIIEQLKTRVRQNPWTAWPVIIFLVLALLVSMVNNLLELIHKIIDIFR